jgi:DNA-binding NarL/FixJ family response regulator
VTTPSPIRVLIADDHTLFRDGLASLLERLPGIELSGQAGTGEEALGIVSEQAPDVVLMDVNMPGIGGIEAARRLHASHPDVAVIMLTMYEDGPSVGAALQAGARGYVLKDSDRGTLQRAIEAAARGEVLLDTRAGALLTQQLGAPTQASSARRAASLGLLTPREREVLDLIARGHDNAGIAELLVISEKTVENHISNVFSKLDVTSRTQAVILALRAGLGA